MWTFIGVSAACLTMFSFFPQILKILRTRSARDVSIITLLQLSLGVTLWIAYGVHLKDPIIITANSVTLLSLGFLLFLYFMYGRSSV
jgi:MtN3 and saliva related transmembrane protein